MFNTASDEDGETLQAQSKAPQRLLCQNQKNWTAAEDRKPLQTSQYNVSNNSISRNQSSQQTDIKPKARLDVWCALAPGERQWRPLSDKEGLWGTTTGSPILLLDAVPAAHTHAWACTHTLLCTLCKHLKSTGKQPRQCFGRITRWTNRSTGRKSVVKNNMEANLFILKCHCQQQEQKRNSPTVFKSWVHTEPHVFYKMLTPTLCRRQKEK